MRGIKPDEDAGFISPMYLEIHPAKVEDWTAIMDVHQQAFAGRIKEARLVELLHVRNKAVISLVAVRDGVIVGHVLFSPVQIEPPQPSFKMLGLAPIAVLPEYQRQGIGSHLIREGLRLCGEDGYGVVVALGDPAYYSRFGFTRARDKGLDNEYHANNDFMVLELQPNALAGIRGKVKYAPEFAEAGC
jgi:putative acetyltransferase